MKYKIEVSTLNLKTAFAVDSIPLETTILQLDTNSFIENENQRLSIQLNFNQPLQINNYYKISVKIGREKHVSVTNQNGLNLIDRNYKEKWISLEPTGNFLEKNTSNKELIFNDNSFNSNEVSAIFSIKNLVKKHNKKHNEDDDYRLKFITIYLNGISVDHYNFYS